MSEETQAPVDAAAAFETAFLALYQPLLSYLFRLTARREDAEDLAQNTYLKAARAHAQFEGGAAFKTWVFAIATNLARDHFRVRRRWYEDSQDQCRATTRIDEAKVVTMRRRVAASEAEAYEFREHIDFCFTCLAKTLEIEQQLALILKDIYHFSIAEITTILDLSEGQVKHRLADARRLMNAIFDRRCVLVSKRGICHQCSEIAGFVNPKQQAHEAARQLKLVQEAEAGALQERLLALRTALIENLDPLAASAAPLHDYLLELIEETAETQRRAAPESVPDA